MGELLSWKGSDAMETNSEGVHRHISCLLSNSDSVLPRAFALLGFSIAGKGRLDDDHRGVISLAIVRS